jgi:S-adenosylmethionine:tRNA ribosyltransferase-isomerase
MAAPQNLNINDFVYELPDVRIAKFPLQNRDESKLLIYRNGQVSGSAFHTIDGFIPPNAFMVFNNTKVIHARLFFRKETGALIEIFCLEPIEPVLHIEALQATGKVEWNCIVGNLKKWKSGDLRLETKVAGKAIQLSASILNRVNESVNIRFEWNGGVTFSEILEVIGKIPIPPYLNRDANDDDNDSYQTVYAKVDGSVAAPTAGLHFTPDVLNRLKTKGVTINEVTLHVGAGTFQPVKSDTIGEHPMHRETIFVERKFIASLLQNKNHVVAIGTTSVRTLESLYWLGVKAHLGILSYAEPILTQWEPYGLPQNITVEQSLLALIQLLDNNKASFLSASTGIIIAPGYNFTIVKAMVTNFHQPRSTLLLLIAAFVGDNWRKIYDYALENNFRFLSYGDSSLLFPK